MTSPPATRALLLAVDDDPAVGHAVERDLRRRYGSRHRVLLADSGEAGLGFVEEIVRRGEPVALLLADQRMPGMSGVEFLSRALKSPRMRSGCCSPRTRIPRPRSRRSTSFGSTTT